GLEPGVCRGGGVRDPDDRAPVRRCAGVDRPRRDLRRPRRCGRLGPGDRGARRPGSDGGGAGAVRRAGEGDRSRPRRHREGVRSGVVRARRGGGVKYPPRWRYAEDLTADEEQEGGTLIGWAWSAPPEARLIVGRRVELDLERREVR